ncbi:hypothetical protein TRIP_C20776 [Candidatus Zixiibacteriota bacterium]|nr:hypothetical protein TRIP_C20776 [candidate division Zixibacteria bacterium]
MKKALLFIIPIILLLNISLYPSTAPRTFQIGYFEGGPYFFHKLLLSDIKKYLDLRNSDSLNIQFYPDGYFSAAWDRVKCRKMAHDISSRKDIDIILAAGPWVVEDLLDAGCKIPIYAIYQFDPEVTGLVDSTGKPKTKNLAVLIRPNKVKSDLAVMERLFPQRKLGFLYFPSGDEFVRMKEKFYNEAGAAIFAGEGYNDRGLYSFFLGLNQIKGVSNLIYLPPLWGMDLDQIRQFFYETQNAKMPTFVYDGYFLLEKDATAGNTLKPYQGMARLIADNIVKIRNGAAPDTLPNKLDDVEDLCLNLEAGHKIGVTFLRKDILDAKVIPIQAGDTLNTYTLPQALEQALRENAGRLASEQIYSAAEAAARNAYVNYYPEFGVSVSSAQTDEGALASKYNNDLNQKFRTAVALDQTIFSYPVIKAIQIARKRLGQEKLTRQQAEFDLRQAVITAYLGVIEGEEKEATLYDIVDRLRDMRDEVDAGVRIGDNDKDDLPLLEERLVEAKINLFDAHRDLIVARAVFNCLVNRPGNYDFLLDRSEFNPDVMAGMVHKYDEYIADANKEKKLTQYLVDIGIENDRGLQFSDLSADIQRDLIARSKWSFLPDLHLRAGYINEREFSPAVSDDHDYWTFGGILNFPLFGNKKSPGTKSLQVEMEAMMYRKDSLRLKRMETVVAGTQEFIARMTTLPLNYFSRNMSLTTLETARDRYLSGKISVFDLLAVENRNSTLSLRTLDDRFSFFRAYVDLLGTLGVGYLKHGTSEETAFYKALEDYLR